MPSAGRESAAALRALSVPGGTGKNTGDLQWKNCTVCNVRLCKGERNAARARTMGSNGKTMRITMEAMKNTRRRDHNLSEIIDVPLNHFRRRAERTQSMRCRCQPCAFGRDVAPEWQAPIHAPGARQKIQAIYRATECPDYGKSD